MVRMRTGKAEEQELKLLSSDYDSCFIERNRTYRITVSTERRKKMARRKTTEQSNYWKKLHRVSGTYKILNNITKEQYVGSSKNIGARWYSHLSMLNSNKHHCQKFQENWNAYGITNFSFIINEVCSKEQLKEKEQELWELEKDLCFNVVSNFRKELIQKERKLHHTEEHKKKISESMKGRNHNEETRKIMSEKKKEYWNKKRTSQVK